jgi:hypothetical protein
VQSSVGSRLTLRMNTLGSEETRRSGPAQHAKRLRSAGARRARSQRRAAARRLGGRLPGPRSAESRRSSSPGAHASWSRERRVVAESENLPKGSNPRFVGTELSAIKIDALTFCEDIYCARG